MRARRVRVLGSRSKARRGGIGSDGDRFSLGHGPCLLGGYARCSTTPAGSTQDNEAIRPADGNIRRFRRDTAWPLSQAREARAATGGMRARHTVIEPISSRRMGGEALPIAHAAAPPTASAGGLSGFLHEKFSCWASLAHLFELGRPGCPHLAFRLREFLTMNGLPSIRYG